MFYEHEITVDLAQVRFQEGMRYVFQNITENPFLAESYFSRDDGKTFDVLDWRLLNRRRRPA